MARPASTFVISLTPFTATGDLDEAGLRAHLRRLASSGIGAYLGGSGSGEGYTLSREEVRRVLEIGVEELRGRVPVRAMGVEPRSAQELIALARLAADVGVEAIQLYSLDMGHGNVPRPDELERYLSDVLDAFDALDISMVLSSHQAAGYAIPPELIDRLLGRYESIVGVNFSHADLKHLLDVLDAVDGRADVHVGGPMHALSCLAMGGQGYLSSEGNLAPSLCVSVIDAYARGDMRACHDGYAGVMRLFAATQRLGGISATKAALRALGLPGGWPRPPRLPFAEDEVGELVTLLQPLVFGSETAT